MMNRFFLPLILVVFALQAYAQAPFSFNYQAVVRDASGNPLANQPISMRVSLLQGSLVGTVVYQETHSVITNAYGQATLAIGAGTALLGSFGAIDWSLGSYFIRTELDATGGSMYILMGTTLLQSVPYALFAQKSAYTAGTGITISGNTISNTSPDQAVSLTAGTGIFASGTYPNFTIANSQPNMTHTGDATGSGTLTVTGIQGRPVINLDPLNGQTLKWNLAAAQWEPANDNNTSYAAGSGILISDGTISNASPDQTVTIGAGPGISTSGTYPNFTITNTKPNAMHTGDVAGSDVLSVIKLRGRELADVSPSNGQVLKWNNTLVKWTPSDDAGTTYNAGTGISIAGSTITNSAPDQTVSIVAGTGMSTSGTYPSFTVTNVQPNATHTGDVIGSTELSLVSIQGKNLSATSPSDRNILQFRTADNKWVATGNNSLQDNDGDTRVQLEKTPDDDLIRFDVAGTERWALTGARIEPRNSGNSLFIGEGAGSLDDMTDNQNTFMGYQTGFLNSTGQYNTASGSYSLHSNTSGNENTAYGYGSLSSNTTGHFNTAVGSRSLLNNTTGLDNTAIGLSALMQNTTGYQNTAVGVFAMVDNSTGESNTAAGFFSLRSNLTGSFNVGLGNQSLTWNTTGSNNTAVGSRSLFSNTTGNNNTASGNYALYGNTLGNYNSATGNQALYTNTSGSNNVAAGAWALYSNTAGNNNAAVGSASLYSNTTGHRNTAIGSQALYANTTGNENTATGYQSLNYNTNGNHNTADGSFALYSNISGNYNTATGYKSLYYNTDGSFNSAHGYLALTASTGGFNAAFGALAMQNNTAGTYNTSIGYSSLSVNTTGCQNTALGSFALLSNTIGHQLTAVGYQALGANTAGSDNLAIGSNALRWNSSGSHNLAIGAEAMHLSGSGCNNIAIGSRALRSNAEGWQNIAIGDSALLSCNSFSNIAIGCHAMLSNTLGTNNLAIGKSTLYYNTTGDANVALGDGSQYSCSTGQHNTSTGYWSLQNNTTGHGNTAIGFATGARQYSGGSNCTFLGMDAGYYSEYNLNNSTAIGSQANIYQNNQVRIGNSSITEIGGQVGWTNYSDGRIKDNIHENVIGLDFILKLRPVTYTINKTRQDELLGVKDSSDYADKYAIEKIRFSGFVAQEVEEAAKAVGYEFSGVKVPENGKGLYGLTYAEFAVPLVKAVQEQQQLIEQQKEIIEELSLQFKEIIKRLEYYESKK